MSNDPELWRNVSFRIGLFATGGYLCGCLECGKTFQGDKRAMYCLPCAIANNERLLARLQAAEEALRPFSLRDHPPLAGHVDVELTFKGSTGRTKRLGSLKMSQLHAAASYFEAQAPTHKGG